MPADWLVPDWPAPHGVRALCTTRSGGVSLPPYQSLNLGAHVGDVPADVAANRATLRDVLGVRPVFLEQVHGVEVRVLDDAMPDGARADACISLRQGLAATVMVADCLPVLLASACGTRVAAAHAGWRGLAAGVLERTLERLAASGGERPIAWLGPCIGPRMFEVGDEVRAAFEGRDPSTARCFRSTGTTGKWWADLPMLARKRLNAAGVLDIHGNDGSDIWCTASNPLRFFSHRRDGVGGRFAACIWLDG
ncbi:MAG: peptidoglycan editing factor PgeF [Pseudomonas sp.]|jgi:YfiH family protein|uniref:peptidoglycan editing factor PgeF n=1 Tax=Pseudomonas sp. TaxID=306 RepID=UPI0011FF9106|nr:peptidoglycan editing factor PgeF [Pseudomonas sp.]RZI74386.1 MAG: peptidoglycan editing factor PgeF [Pseudomonas sp.]